MFFPSLPIIIYGIVAKTSITQLFAAGLIPGIFLVLILSLYSGFVARKLKAVRTKTSFREIMATARVAKWEAFIPLLLMVGIFGGFVTLGEVASIIVCYMPSS